MQINRSTVLLVEDEPLLRELMCIELEDAGYRVTEACDGDAALRLLDAEERIDLLMTDIRLPGAIDGWAVARHARACRPDLPVIYATGFCSPPVDMVPGATLMRKPFASSAMIAAVAGLGVPPNGRRD
jgi:CheY-like chemotaxis protein